MFVICLSGGLEPKTPHFEFIWIGLIPGMGPYRGCLFNAIFRQLLALSIAHLGKKANAFLCRLLSYKHKKKMNLTFSMSAVIVLTECDGKNKKDKY